MTTKVKPLILEVGESASFFSEAKDKNITGTIIKVNNKTAILEVKKERTIIEKVKGIFGKLSKDKEKKTTVTETKHIKKKINQLAA